jgi:hypothetical protein
VAGKSVYGHGGNILGYSSILLYSPDDSITVAVIVNETTDATPVGLALMNLAMNRKASGVRADAGSATGLAVRSIRTDAAGALLTFDYTSAGTVPLTLGLYDLLGREVMKAQAEEPGAHTATFDVSRLPRGMYVWRLTEGSRIASGTVAL